jgi:leucyl-tRNA synthetase
MFYDHKAIDNKWQKFWQENQTFKTSDSTNLPKYYVLDMFPYPSGAGLHVGHPLGYIASDIIARYKRHQGFNVLHPQGYDSFGLPAEQYAIQTGQHPANTTEINIEGCLDKNGNILAKYVNEDGIIKDTALIEKSKKVSINDENYRDNIIKGYRRQLDKIGFSFDWSREVRTSNADYYKHTQWIFIELFNSWYNKDSNKAESIETLIQEFEKNGNATVNAVCDDYIAAFSSIEWNAFSSDEQQKIVLKYRLTYLAETEVNWCPGLGTVLANDEIVNGVSERGGFPVVRKKMTQWSMRISAYAERLLQGLNEIDWTESLKESQRNWIGKSVGAMVSFNLKNHDEVIDVFTTRPDTIFGVTFMTLAPEHDLVAKITTPEQKEAVEKYIESTAKRSERERMADVKTISGVFTGAFAEHPFTKEAIPVWIGDYVLAGYGTGAVMAVPCGDERDYAFANFFKGKNGMLEIKNIFDQDISEEAFGAKEGFKLVDSDFLNGLGYKEGTKKAIEALENINQGKGKTNYRLRDAVFSRQRYWGEPFPVYYVNGLPQMIDKKHLPIALPEVEKYLPTEDGQPPLGNANIWAWNIETNQIVDNQLIDHKTIFPLELNTMPGWAGSSWYWLRYMDAHNEDEFASKESLDYWGQVDLYIGGSEHATGHLLYSRFWNKFLKDRGFIEQDEPFKKLINQGMILGESAFVNRLDLPRGYIITYKDGHLHNDDSEMFKNLFISSGISKKILNVEQNDFKNYIYDCIQKKYNVEDYNEVLERLDLIEIELNELPVDVSFIEVHNNLNISKFCNWRQELKDAKFIFEEDGKFLVSREVEKMSKSKYNVVNPDDICEEYGADCLRLYEMFLGPLEQSKPWNTQGLSGVYGFLKRFYNLYYKEDTFSVSDEEPTKEELKVLHTLIKKFETDIQNFSFNTSVSSFMIAANDLQKLKCNKRAILEPLAIVISPYAPHICEELWRALGHETSIEFEKFPELVESYLVEDEIDYPVSFNGKMRFILKLSANLSKEEIEKYAMEDERVVKFLEGKQPKKIIIVPKKIINIVI